jgi:hypothetical protein
MGLLGTCSGFGIYDPEADVWREDLLKALIL